MRLWLFSSGDARSNADADERFVAELYEQLPKGRQKPRLAFVPSSKADMGYYWPEFRDRFAEHGLTDVECFPLDDGTFSRRARRSLLGADMIYLSGGNTFHFLYWLRVAGLVDELRSFAADGGVLAGHSAGAILMTPSIITAGFPEHDRDDNLVGIKDVRALRLVAFEIFPHYRSGLTLNLAIKKSSLRMGRPIYGVPDGSAVSTDEGRVTFHGPIWGFVKGVRFRV